MTEHFAQNVIASSCHLYFIFYIKFYIIFILGTWCECACMPVCMWLVHALESAGLVCVCLCVVCLNMQHGYLPCIQSGQGTKFSSITLPFCLRIESLAEQETFHSDEVTGLQGFRILLSAPQSWGDRMHSRTQLLYLNAKKSNLGPHAWRVSAEPSSPWNLVFAFWDRNSSSSPG